MDSAHTSLSNHFLIDMPGMTDPEFAGSLVYLCSHDANGAMGLMVNRSLDLRLRSLFEQFDLTATGKRSDQFMLYGGPVQRDRGFVLHSSIPGLGSATQTIGRGIELTASKDIVKQLARDDDLPKHSLVVLGYAGWESGQLEAELLENAWLVVPATPELLFETPLEQRVKRTATSIGVDLSKLSGWAGHA